jgi:hypothetical protein
MQTEIDTLQGWEGYKTLTTQAVGLIKSCMQLLQKMENVGPMLATFVKYGMINQSDEDVATVNGIVRQLQGDRGIKLNEVTNKSGRLDEILGGLEAQHFRFIDAVGQADQLVSFLDKDKEGGRDFYSEEGKRKYEEKKKLVDAQIQSSASRDHHGRLLNAFDIKAIPLCECFATMKNRPLSDVVQAIAGIRMLKTAEAATPGREGREGREGVDQIDSLCKALRDTNDNMVVVKSWFTRASLSSFEHAGEMMKQLRSTGKVIVELRRLIDEDTLFKICYKHDTSQDQETVMTASDIDELESGSFPPLFCLSLSQVF